MTPVLILLGPPGAGKGTQAGRLCAERGLVHIATGDLFREHLAKDTALGRQAREYVESGQLVPDSLVLDMLFQRVSQPDCRRGLILDGFPRTIAQAEALEKRFGRDWSIEVIELYLDDASIVRRLSGRMICQDCEHIQNTQSAPPKVPGRCDQCSGELQRRSDDEPEVVKRRLAVYREKTAPITEFYAKRGMLKRVSGDRSADAVFKDLLEVSQTGAKELA